MVSHKHINSTWFINLFLSWLASTTSKKKKKEHQFLKHKIKPSIKLKLKIIDWKSIITCSFLVPFFTDYNSSVSNARSKFSGGINLKQITNHTQQLETILRKKKTTMVAVVVVVSNRMSSDLLTDMVSPDETTMNRI